MANDLIRGANLSETFDLGMIEPDTIHIRVDGTTIVRDPVSGVLSAPAAAGAVLNFIGYANVNADGTTAAASPGVTVTQTAVGRYDVTPPPGAVTVILSVFESETIRDDIKIFATDFQGSRVYIVENDNGGTAGIFRSRSWSATWVGS